MNKSEFVSYIAERNKCTKVEAEKIVDVFTDSIIGAISDGNEVSLIGFGHFAINEVAARVGRNPSTGKALDIPAYKQVRFKVGQKLKDAGNAKK